MTKGILQPALRQYRHNDSDEFVIGFDRKEVEAVVDALFARIIELENNLQRELLSKEGNHGS